MRDFFKLAKYKDCEDLSIVKTNDNIYLGVDDVTLLNYKEDYGSLLNILRELDYPAMNQTNLYLKIGEFAINCMLENNKDWIDRRADLRLAEVDFNFSNLESDISRLLKLVPSIDMTKYTGEFGLVWGGSFCSKDFINARSYLNNTLNQSEIVINKTDSIIIMQEGDILSLENSDYYNEDIYFVHRACDSKYSSYVELAKIKADIVYKLVKGDIKLKFKNTEIKKEVLKEFTETLMFCMTKLNYSEDVENDLNQDLMKMISIIAFADTIE